MKLDVRSAPIVEVLKGKYKVPYYQRGYAWSKENVEDLLEDIWNSINEVELISEKDIDDYFVGSIVVSSDESNRLFIVDGQQRLTTLSLIIHCLSNRFKEYIDDLEDKENVEKITNKINGLDQMIKAKRQNIHGDIIVDYQLELSENNNDVYKSILEGKNNDEIVQMPKFTKSSEMLLIAVEVITDFIQGRFKDLSDLFKFSFAVAEKVTMIIVYTEKQKVALKIFGVLNDRGVNLKPEDLIKHILFKNVNDDQFEKVSIKWSEITNKIEKKHSVTDFFRHYISIHEGKIVKKDNLIDHFEDLSNNWERDSWKLMEDIFHYSTIYYDLITYDKLQLKNGIKLDAREYKKLKKMKLTQISTIIFSVLSKLEKDHVKTLSKMFEIYIFSEIILMQNKISSVESDLLKYANKLRNVSPDNEKIVFEEVSKSLINWYKIKRIEMSEKIVEFRHKYNRKECKPVQSDISKIKYMLGEISILLDNDYFDKYEVEHIIPQISLSSKAGNSDGSFEKAYKEVCSIGNCVLLTKSDNAAAKDKLLLDKKNIYKSASPKITKSVTGIIKTGTINTKIDKVLLDSGLNHSDDNWNEQNVSGRAKAYKNILIKEYDSIFGFNNIN